MHVVFDAFAVRRGSAAISVEYLLGGWVECAPGDRITVLCAAEPAFSVPPGVKLHRMRPPVRGPVGELWLRSFGVRLAARQLAADAVVSAVTASALFGAPCPHGAIVYDLRHEQRPHQFGRARRVTRRLSYAWSFWVADALFCISERTREDLVRSRPRLHNKAVVARFGADHADSWPAPNGTEPAYALAFGQFENKNALAVLDAWALFSERHRELTLRLVGMSAKDRELAEDRVRALGIGNRVELLPWLDDEQFVSYSTAARLIVYPSDFEGFGLPAVEALRRRIPLVVSDDRALAEVTGGHASVAADSSPQTLAAAMENALARTPEQLLAGWEYSSRFKWCYAAEAIRTRLTPGAEGSPCPEARSGLPG